MRIDSICHTNFYGRKINLKQAQEMCNMVQKEYPYPSLWKQGKFEFAKVVRENPDENTRLKAIIALRKMMDVTGNKLDDLREYYSFNTKNAFKYFSMLADGIKRFQTLNCAEAARIIYMISRINDVDEDDTGIAQMEIEDSGDSRSVDHVIAKIKGESGMIGIDGLLGESAKIDNFGDIYQSKYSDGFTIPHGAHVGFVDKVIPRLTDEEAEELKKLHPEFVLKK